jgi:putative ABC transport system permease protein
MDGAMALHNFTVAGTVRFGLTAIDKGAVIADITDIQSVLDMTDGASEIPGYSKDMMYDDSAMVSLARTFNAAYSDSHDEFSPFMLALSQQNELGEYIRFIVVFGGIIVIIFMIAMSIVLWNSALLNGLRRYGEIGVRLAIGESKGTLYRWMIAESVCTGIVGGVLGTVLGLAVSLYLQYNGIDISGVMQKSSMLLSNVIRARVTSLSYVIGFIPGIAASVLGTMFAGIGIYRRQTSQLFKELEV